MTYTFRPGIVRGVSYGLFGPPDSFVPEMRSLGARLARVYVYWNQVEPRPGEYDWRAVDAILAQRDPSMELWVTVCSSSTWATAVPTPFLPSSPARRAIDYERFLSALVGRCRGRVEHWQCNNEPSNTGMLWAGTAADYVEQLAVFHRVVRAIDPRATVVLGGCGYDVLSSPPGAPARQFFDHVAEYGRDLFDLFDVHLYGDPAAIGGYVTAVQDLMRRHGYDRPVVAGEYNGPTFFEFPAAMAAVAGLAMADPEAAMRALYARAGDLPREVRMFMDDAPPDVAAERDRINCRQMVIRNVLAFAAGVTRTLCWNLAPEIPGYRDRYNVMGFLFGKLALLDYDGGAMTVRHPAADTFALVASYLDGATAIRPAIVPGACAFDVTRASGDVVRIAWTAGDAITAAFRWPAVATRAVDAFGDDVPVTVEAGRVRVPISETPVFLSA